MNSFKSDSSFERLRRLLYSGVYKSDVCRKAMGMAVLFFLFFLEVTGCSDNNAATQSQTSNAEKAAKGLQENQVALGTAAESDLGYVKPKSKHVVALKIVNSAEEGFAVRRVRSECKCMLVSDPPRAISAKSETPIQIDFIAPKKPQRYDRRLFIQTEDGRLTTIRVMADVGRPLMVEPQAVDLGALVPGKKYIEKVRLRNRGDQPIRPICATSSQEGVIARLPGTSIESQEEAEIPIEVVLQNTPLAKGQVVVTVHTDCPEQSVVSLNLVYASRNDSGGPTP